MPKFVVERTFPGAGTLTKAEIEAMLTTHCEIVKAIGPQIQWLESYMTADKVYCIYVAPDAATIRLHAELGGFPIDSVLEVKQVLDTQTYNLWTRNQPSMSPGFAEA
jgi:hypothetical protein